MPSGYVYLICVALGEPLSNLSQFTSYFAFCAVVVLYVYTIQQRASPVETYSDYFAAATRCQNQVAKIAEKGSLTQRYCLVLEELRLEALRQTKRSQAAGSFGPQLITLGHTGGQDGSGRLDPALQTDRTLDLSLGYSGIIPDDGVDWNASPSSSLAEMTSWGQFDSMVSLRGRGHYLCALDCLHHCLGTAEGLRLSLTFLVPGYLGLWRSRGATQ